MDCLTSKPRLVRSWSTAQDASKSRPLMLMDPNLMEVGGLGAWRGAVGSLVWSFCSQVFCEFLLMLVRTVSHTVNDFIGPFLELNCSSGVESHG
jgi:hypothetical protein